MLLLLFSLYVMSNSVTPWTAACQASFSLTVSLSSLKLMSIESVMPSNLCCSFSSCLHQGKQSFPASGSFPTSWFFVSGGQSIGASASALPMNIQGWFPLGLIALVSLLSKGLSRVFSSTTVQKHQFSVLSLLYDPTLTPAGASRQSRLGPENVYGGAEKRN